MLIKDQEVRVNNGTEPLRKALQRVVAQGSGDYKDALFLLRALDKLESDSEEVELNDSELAAIKKCIERQALIPEFAVTVMYHLFPDEFAESDKEAIKRRFHV